MIIHFNRKEEQKKIMDKKENSNISLGEELSEFDLEKEDLRLFDDQDKVFLGIYLFIFIFGIIITVLSI